MEVLDQPQAPQQQTTQLPPEQPAQPAQDTQPAQPPATPTEPPATPEPPDLNKLLGEATKGQITSMEQLNSVLQRAQQPQQPQELQYASDLAKQIDDLVTKGATQQEVDNWLQLRSLNIDNFSPMEAIRQEMMYKNPGMSPQKVDVLIRNKYKDLNNEDEPDAAQLAEAQLEWDANNAKRFLLDKRGEAATPSSVRDAQAVKDRQVQTANAWQAHLQQSIFPEFSKFPIAVDDYKFDFPIGADVLQRLNAGIVNFAVRENLNPNDPLGQNAIRDFTKRALFAEMGEKILATALRDAIAKTREVTVKSESNVGPVERPTQNNKGGQQQKVDPLAEILKNPFA